MHRLHPSDDEARHLLDLYGSPVEASKALTMQFTVIQSRTQLLLTLATILLSVTGFSGPRIAQSGPFARDAMVLGLCSVLAGVILALLGSLRIRWLTQFIDSDPHRRLSAIIAYRNRKTAWFAIEVGMVVGGLACFVIALVDYLLTVPMPVAG